MSSPDAQAPQLKAADSPRVGTWPRWAPLGAAGFLGLGAGSLILPTNLRDLALNALNAAVFLLAMGAALAKSTREPAAGRGWRLFAAAMAAQGAAQLWALLLLLQQGAPPPYPSAADIGSFLSLGLMVAALGAWPLTSMNGSERLRLGLDGLGVAIASFFIGWYLALGPLFRAASPTWPLRLVLVGFFLCNAAILGLCVFLGARQPSRFRGPLGWILGAFVLSLGQVAMGVPLELKGRYYLGHPLDLLVLGAGLCVLAAGLSPRALLAEPTPGDEVRDSTLAALLLPSLPSLVVLLFALGSFFHTTHTLDRPFLGMGIALLALGLLRGLMAILDLQRLSAALETRVQERTHRLEAMQDAMLKTERMNAMAVLGAGLAHDLNNSLTTVKACAELALMKVEDGEVPARKDLEHILVAADQSATLTNRLMRFGHLSDEPSEALSPVEEITGMEPMLRMLLGRRISLRLELAQAPMSIQATRGHLEQILVNLVSNARDAMPQGGSITIRLAGETQAGVPSARIEVEDTGEGMSPEVQARLFQPFFTTKGPNAGTGLGLASVRQLMKEVGGSLAVDSMSGRGSTFILHIPLA